VERGRRRRTERADAIRRARPAPRAPACRWTRSDSAMASGQPRWRISSRPAKAPAAQSRPLGQRQFTNVRCMRPRGFDCRHVPPASDPRRRNYANAPSRQGVLRHPETSDPGSPCSAPQLGGLLSEPSRPSAPSGPASAWWSSEPWREIESRRLQRTSSPTGISAGEARRLTSTAGRLPASAATRGRLSKRTRINSARVSPHAPAASLSIAVALWNPRKRQRAIRAQRRRSGTQGSRQAVSAGLAE
jgi:hypothetical protein